MIKVNSRDTNAIKNLAYGEEYQIAMGKGRFIGYKEGNPVLLEIDNSQTIWINEVNLEDRSTRSRGFNYRDKSKSRKTLKSLYEKLESRETEEEAA